MRMFLISDNVDTYTGMRLAGVDGVVVHSNTEL
jgi:V/A-type H+-transporting ATPase subunit F